MGHPRGRPRPRGGFTLLELLVVVVIVVLVSAAALPTILPALAHRQVSETARILQAGLAGARDAAIRANAPRGIRLLPDPVFPGPWLSNSNFTDQRLASNRFVPIEPAPDYSEGRISLGTPHNNNPNYTDPIGVRFIDVSGYITTTGLPLYCATTNTLGANYPFYYQGANPAGSATNLGPGYPFGYGRIGVQECFATATTVANSAAVLPQNPNGTIWIPNSRTSWAWNIRQGDKIRLDDTGRQYTIAGPMVVGVFDTGHNLTNPERFINYGLPGASAAVADQPEYLFLVNGQDDDNDGWVDESFDGVDNDGDGVIDPGYNGVDDDGDGRIDNPGELFYNGGGEFEAEVFVGAQFNVTQTNVNTSSTDASTSFATSLTMAGAPAQFSQIGQPVLMQDYPAQSYFNKTYAISRRPVVTDGVKETVFPDGVVIDLTTWNASDLRQNGNPGVLRPSLPERSRLPVDPYTYYVDVMIAPNGQVVPAGAGVSSTTSGGSGPLSSLPFYHFWIAERGDVHAPMFGTAPIGNRTPVIASFANPGYLPTGGPGGLLSQIATAPGGAATAIQNYNQNNLPFTLPLPADAGDSLGTVGRTYGLLAKSNPGYAEALKGERRLVTLFTRTGQLATTEAFNFLLNDINAPYYEAQIGVREVAK